jgi:hypothetical protein
MAWEHGHHQQMLMDSTFGVCSARILLFILMVINKQNKGIPVATIMFMARKEAQATHTDYNTELLKDLLAHWKAGMGKHLQTGEEFIISVANTDNDPRKRNTLSSNWPNSFLLYCRFHTWQAWRNGLTQNLACISKGDACQLADF